MQSLKILLICICFFLSFAGNLAAQEIRVIEGDTLAVNREVTGPLNLFWSEKNYKYRYFLKKGEMFVELEEDDYREQLKALTADTRIKVRDVKFLLYSLRQFVNQYNELVEDDYEYNNATEDIRTRIGLFTGISNNKFTENPENILAPVVGLEFEFFDPNLAPRHAAFLQLRQSFKQDEYRYSSTQLSVNYRFRIFYFDAFDLHIDAELATFLYSEDQIRIKNEAGEVTAIRDEDGFSFTAPFSFGIGSDIKVTKNGYISLGYNDIVSIVLEGNDHFPLDFTVGLKYNF